MEISQRGIDLIKGFEGLFLKAYKDPIGIITIGYGTVVYPSEKRVQMGETITEAQAEEYLKHEINLKADVVNTVTADLILTQGQFDALVSFAYNLGTGALKQSTLLKKVKLNPDDPAIRTEFMKWVRAGRKVFPGLVRRRKAEADLYFS